MQTTLSCSFCGVGTWHGDKGWVNCVKPLAVVQRKISAQSPFWPFSADFRRDTWFGGLCHLTKNCWGTLGEGSTLIAHVSEISCARFDVWPDK